LIDRGDRDHERCRQALENVTSPMITTWAVLTEAMYLLGGLGGWSAQRALWQMVEIDELKVVEIQPPFAPTLRSLMDKYKDVPMDLADATLIAIADSQGFKRIFTLDSDFLVYRYRGREPFELIP
jgi:uncharacterized protein